MLATGILNLDESILFCTVMLSFTYVSTLPLLLVIASRCPAPPYKVGDIISSAVVGLSVLAMSSTLGQDLT